MRTQYDKFRSFSKEPRMRRAYFQTRELSRIFFLKVRASRQWPQLVAWSEMPVSKGFLVTWYD